MFAEKVMDQTAINTKNMQKLCRICLEEALSLMSLFDREFSLPEIIESFTTVSITLNDGLPQRICSDCFNGLNEAYDFKIKCEKADKRLREFMDQGNTYMNDEECGKMDETSIFNLE